MILSGCSNLVDKGDRLYEEGMYQGAAEFYEKALLKNPDNVEAAIGLNRARNMINNRGLIEVRMLRLGSNHAGATQKLETILRNQQLWNIEIQGAVSLTQAEETQYAEKWLRNEAASLAQSTQPDKFRWFTNSYAYLIANTQLQAEIEQLQPRLRKLGQQQCDSLMDDVSGQRFYLHRFVKNYCAAWGGDAALTVDSIDHSRYNRLDTTQQLGIKTVDNSGQLAVLHQQLSQLEDQFKRSLWFSDSGASSLALHLTGHIKQQRSTQLIKRSVRYTVDQKIKLSNGTTELRTVKKTFTFPVRQHNEKYNVRIAYNAKVSSRTLAHRLVKSETHHTEEHNTTFRPANISPIHAYFMDTQQKLTGMLGNAHLELLDKLDKLWVTDYCEQGLGNHRGEHILRCGKAVPDNAYVNSWMVHKFGVGYEAMARMYGL